MTDFLAETQFDFIAPADKDFIRAWDAAMTRLGYDFGGKIGSGYCWGRYMLIYTKTGAKSRNVFARIYIRERGIVLRLFLNDVDCHRAFIEQSPAYIKDVFTGDHGKCSHCHNDKGGKCRFRKTYTIDGRLIEKCNGYTFEFNAPTLENLPGYLALFNEFFPAKGAARLN